jgi:hypothetical protein
MSDIVKEEQKKVSRRFLDVFVVVFCISGAAASLYMFYQDYIGISHSSDNSEIGIVIDQSKIIRRRLSSKKVWKRILTESPIYNGDYIRNDDQFSSATLDISGSKIKLGENTFIRVMKDMGQLNIEQVEGNSNISVTSSKNSETVLLVLKNQTVEILPETEVNVVSTDDGLVLLNFAGSGAKVTSDGQVKNVSSGDVIIQDSDGREVRKPMAAISQPKPNAQLIKTGTAPLNVEFNWLRINMLPQDILRLEVASDINFTRLLQSIDYLDSNVTRTIVRLNTTGVIFWRFLYEGLELTSGRMNVTEASPPALLAPASNSSAGTSVRYAGEEVQFRWAEVPNAAYYILQISELDNFTSPEIETPVYVPSFISSDIDVGTWFWRVKPVFPNAYDVNVGFSQASSFQVEAPNAPAALAAPAAALSEDNSGNSAAVSAAIAEKEKEDEDKSNEELFLALQKETKQIWQEQQIIRAQLPQTQIVQADSVLQTSQAPSVPQAQLQVSRETQQTQQNQQQPLRLTLIAPAQNMVLPGLTALRQPTTFRWNTDEDIVFSRFVLSSNADPVSGRPLIDIQNPGRTVEIPRLAEGTWYWTIEGRSRDGRPITAVSPRQIRVQPVPLLPTPQNRQPAVGYIIGAEQLRQKNIVFSWSRVEGANSYVLSILKDGFPGKQQIFMTEPMAELTYKFEDFSIFEASGVFYWQVEAVFYNSAGRLEQRGMPGENTFMIDVPRPGRAQLKSGTHYGR